MGFTELLTLLFVFLKGVGYLHWSWWLVFAPEYVAALFWLIVILIVIVSYVAFDKSVTRPLKRNYPRAQR